MKNKLIIVVILIVLAGAGIYWLNIPHNYNDCILKYMKNEGDRLAVIQVMSACKDKFPNDRK